MDLRRLGEGDIVVPFGGVSTWIYAFASVYHLLLYHKSRRVRARERVTIT
jgi:hypothetical protein